MHPVCFTVNGKTSSVRQSNRVLNKTDRDFTPYHNLNSNAPPTAPLQWSELPLISMPVRFDMDGYILHIKTIR